MVVRFALGLSAQGGLVCGIASDTTSGAVVCATLRHLVNAGSEAVLLVTSPPGRSSFRHLDHLLASAVPYGIRVEFWNDPSQTPLVEDVVKECHNVLFGCAALPSEESSNTETEMIINGAVQLLNELSTPVHCVMAPHGISLSTGDKTGEHLYASSTLSLGAPLEVLSAHEDLLGRHYLADLSFPLSMYQKIDQESLSPFTEQPVVQLHLEKPES